jgi:outer membrane protein assembly factor BamB
MKNRTRYLALLFALLVLCPAAFGQSPSWPRWRGPNGDGISTETGWNPKALEGGAKVAWKADIGFGYSDVVIEAGRLYTMGLVEGKWTFHCLDALSGKRIWQRSFDSVMEPMSTPCVDGDRVFGLGKDGTVVCLQTSDGKLLWRKSLKDDFGISDLYYGWASSPVVEGQLLLLSAGFAGLALDKKTGSLAWASTKVEGEYASGFGHYATPVVCDFDGKRCGLFYGQMMLSAVDLATGQRVWSFFHFAAHPISDPIVSGTRIFLSTAPKTMLMEMALGSPKTVWTNSDLLTAALTPVLVDGFVYCSNKGPFPFPNLAWDVYEEATVPVRCVELATGKVMWESARKMPLSQTCAAAGKLILLDVKGTLRIVEASPVEYREISSADVLGGAKRPRRFAVPPVLCGGKVYCRNYAGDLVCIDVSK